MHAALNIPDSRAVLTRAITSRGACLSARRARLSSARSRDPRAERIRVVRAARLGRERVVLDVVEKSPPRNLMYSREKTRYNPSLFSSFSSFFSVPLLSKIRFRADASGTRPENEPGEKRRRPHAQCREMICT